MPFGRKNDLSTDKYLNRQHRVLLRILALSLLSAMTSSVESVRMLYVDFSYSYSMPLSEFTSMCYTLIPVPGVMLLGFLSEISGRKPTLLLLFSLSILNSILNTSQHLTVYIIGRVIQTLVRGGVAMMTFLAITEYSCPKHRFAYLVANAATFRVVSGIVTVLMIKVFEQGTNFVQILEIIIGIVCLLTPCPESPYWLASSGKYKESREAFLFLRGEENEDELQTLLEEDHQPSSPRFLWLPLISAIATTFVSQAILWQGAYVTYKIENIDTFMDYHVRTITEICCGIVVLMTIVWVSYRVKRKDLYMSVTIMPLALYIIVALWLYGERTYNPSDAFHVALCILNVLLFCGPYTIGLASFMEIIPHKYNTVMATICSVFSFISNYFFYQLKFPVKSDYPVCIIVAILSSISICAVIVYSVLSPETKDKTLKEIQKLHTGEQNDANTSVADEIALRNLSRII